MANRKFWLGIQVMLLVFGMTIIGCDNDSTDEVKTGKLTITGLSAYNGKYVMAFGENDDEDILYAAAGKSSNNDAVYAGKIKNGSVTLKVWKVGIAGLSSFSGSCEVELFVGILNTATITMDSMEDESSFIGGGYVSVNFIKGVGTGTFTSALHDVSNATPLISNQWATETFTSTTSSHCYSFTVNTETTYYFWINDEGGNSYGGKTANVTVEAYYENGLYAFYGDDDWDDPVEFTPVFNGTVYVIVEPYNSGTYAIAYNTSGTRP